MTRRRALMASGELPAVMYDDDAEVRHDHHVFQQALCHRPDNMFQRLARLFARIPETDVGPGSQYLCGLIGQPYTGARATVYALATHFNIPILDMTVVTGPTLQSLTIREIIQHITDTPPRCVILIDMAEERMQKVIRRMSTTAMDIRSHRVVFCLTMDEMQLPTDVHREHFPGTIDDKIAMLMYRIPMEFVDPDRLRAIAASMHDYAVFEPKIWDLIRKDSADVFFSTLQFQVMRRARFVEDTALDDFPSFETQWRRSLCRELQQALVPSPDSTSLDIHRVLPAGVSSVDAIKCFQTALPANLVHPYALTVSTESSDSTCGSILITQETVRIIVNIHCNVDPGILVDVCRELRSGHRTMVRELALTKSEMTKELGRTKMEMADQLGSLRSELSSLSDLIRSGKRPFVVPADETQCTKKSCTNQITEQFQSGRLKKQCSACNSQSNRSRRRLVSAQ